MDRSESAGEIVWSAMASAGWTYLVLFMLRSWLGAGVGDSPAAFANPESGGVDNSTTTTTPWIPSEEYLARCRGTQTPWMWFGSSYSGGQFSQKAANLAKEIYHLQAELRQELAGFGSSGAGRDAVAVTLSQKLGAEAVGSGTTSSSSQVSPVPTENLVAGGSGSAQVGEGRAHKKPRSGPPEVIDADAEKPRPVSKAPPPPSQLDRVKDNEENNKHGKDEDAKDQKEKSQSEPVHKGIKQVDEEAAAATKDGAEQVPVAVASSGSTSGAKADVQADGDKGEERVLQDSKKVEVAT